MNRVIYSSFSLLHFVVQLRWKGTYRRHVIYAKPRGPLARLLRDTARISLALVETDEREYRAERLKVEFTFLYSSKASVLTLITWHIRLPSWVRGNSGMGTEDEEDIATSYQRIDIVD